MAKRAGKARGVYEYMKPAPTDFFGVPLDWKPVIPTGVWYIRYRDKTGVLHRERVGPRGTALELYGKRRNEVVEGKFRPEKVNRRRRYYVKDLIQDWIEYARANKKSHRDDEERMRFWFARLGDRPADSVTNADVERFKTLLNAEGADGRGGVAPETVNHYLKVLRAAYYLAIGRGKVDHNPARSDRRGERGVRYNRTPMGRIRYLADEEETQLLAVFSEPEKPMIRIALNTGIRMSGFRIMEWSDVDFGAGVILVRANKNGQPYKVPMNTIVRKALLDQRRFMPSTAYVFPNWVNATTQDMSRWFVKKAKAAGLADVTFHIMRHTFASRLVMAGVDLATVKELMGHTDIRMTLRYAHLSPDHKQRAVEILTQKGDNRERSITSSIIGDLARGAIQAK